MQVANNFFNLQVLIYFNRDMIDKVKESSAQKNQNFNIVVTMFYNKVTLKHAMKR